MIKVRPLYILLFILLFCACGDSDSGNEKVNFDREAMLINMADGLIIPAYADFQAQVALMHEAILAFTGAPDLTSLQEAKTRMASAWETWQYVAFFAFGPAMEANLRNNVNIFPTDSAKIEQNIPGTYDLNAASNADAKGFPALDYLLYGVAETEQSVVDYYADSQAGSSRGKYLTDISAQIDALAIQVLEGWQDYRATFVNSLGTEVGSSTGLLVNELNYQYDLGIKNGKIGIPAGKKSLGTTFPTKVEAYYSGASLELALAGLYAFKAIFTGTTYEGQQNNAGLDDYLDALDAQYNGQPLSTAIVNQLNLGIEATQNIPEPLSEAVNTQQEAVDKAYLEIQRLVALIKVDMTSALGVLITFQDNDGD